jgi:hypothetical protein
MIRNNERKSQSPTIMRQINLPPGPPRQFWIPWTISAAGIGLAIGFAVFLYKLEYHEHYEDYQKLPMQLHIETRATHLIWGAACGLAAGLALDVILFFRQRYLMRSLRRRSRAPFLKRTDP